MYVHVYVCTYGFKRIMCVAMYASVRVRECMYACMYVHVYVYFYMYVYIYIYIYLRDILTA